MDTLPCRVGGGTLRAAAATRPTMLINCSLRATKSVSEFTCKETACAVGSSTRPDLQQTSCRCTGVDITFHAFRNRNWQTALTSTRTAPVSLVARPTRPCAAFRSACAMFGVNHACLQLFIHADRLRSCPGCRAVAPSSMPRQGPSSGAPAWPHLRVGPKEHSVNVHDAQSKCSSRDNASSSPIFQFVCSNAALTSDIGAPLRSRRALMALS